MRGWYVLVLCLAVRLTAQDSGQIVGAVQTTDGAGVGQANVRIWSAPLAPGPAVQPFQAIPVTGASGVFNPLPVPVGRYQICAESPDPALLSDCAWGSPTFATVTAGQTTALPAIQLRPGVDLYVRVNDPVGKVAALQGSLAGASVMLAVSLTNGFPVHLRQTSKDDNGFDYHLLVPPATSLTVRAFSTVFTLADESGATANQATGIVQTINIPADVKQRKIIVTVTGVN